MAFFLNKGNDFRMKHDLVSICLDNLSQFACKKS
jgi:hypothetical protein